MDRDYDGSIVVQKRIKRYRGRNRKIEAFFRVSEIVLISLFLLSHYLFGVSTATAAEFFQRLICILSKPLHVFFISNVIVIAVTVLSVIDAGDGKNEKSGCVANGIYNEYVARCRGISVGGNDLEVSPMVVDVPEDEKRIVLFTSSCPLVEGEKGLPTATAAAHDGCAKIGCPRRGTKDEKLTGVASPRGRGRFALPGVVGGHASGVSAAAPSNGSVSNDPPWMRMKAEKVTHKAKLRRRARSALPDVIGKNAPEALGTAVTVPATAGKHVILKSLSEASINGDKALPTVVVPIGHCGAKNNSPRQREMGDENPVELPSPRGRGRLVAVRDVGSKTVEDLSNDEFNRSVANYIAKTRRFLREESMREIDFDTLYRDQSADQPIEHRRSFCGSNFFGLGVDAYSLRKSRCN